MKKAIYTVMTRNYDSIPVPQFIDKDIEYLAFTDSAESIPKPWSKIEIDTSGMTQFEKLMVQRKLKIEGHEELKSFEKVMYHDANFFQLKSTESLFEKFAPDINLLVAMSHPWRNCVFEEIETCIKSSKAPKDKLKAQFMEYERLKIPKNFGLIAAGFMIRDFNSENWKNFGPIWYNNLLQFSHRDQISFSKTIWELGIDWNSVNTIEWDKIVEGTFAKIPHRIKTTY